MATVYLARDLRHDRDVAIKVLHPDLGAALGAERFLAEIKTKGLVQSVFAGDYHSVFKGRGMNFEDVREYQPGDEIRAIDWNVTARLGTAFVKKFTEERELTVVLVVDVSASGNFGSVSQSKRELAAESPVFWPSAPFGTTGWGCSFSAIAWSFYSPKDDPIPSALFGESCFSTGRPRHAPPSPSIT
jgi:hypothetical protein